MPPSLVVGLIAGGDRALRNPVEFAEDDEERGWEELRERSVSSLDTVIGIAASGTTPYVVGALRRAREHGVLTACITSNPGSPLAAEADIPIEMVVGPEFVTGSSRMKSGTGQKMICNMITTATMIRLGRVRGNRMVNMQLSNDKLIDRGTLRKRSKRGATAKCRSGRPTCSFRQARTDSGERRAVGSLPDDSRRFPYRGSVCRPYFDSGLCRSLPFRRQRKRFFSPAGAFGPVWPP